MGTGSQGLWAPAVLILVIVSCDSLDSPQLWKCDTGVSFIAFSVALVKNPKANLSTNYNCLKKSVYHEN